MEPETLLKELARRVPLRNSRSLSRIVMELVSDGELPPGIRMPTVRQTAQALGMSVASVAAAWRELVDWRVLDTKRRGGTFVMGQAKAPRAARYEVMMKATEGIPLNLGHLTPDRVLLPPLKPALAAAAVADDLQSNVPTPISRALRQAIEPLWPFAASFYLATQGGADAVNMALRASVRPGDRVLVEMPIVSRVLDILDSIGAVAVPIARGADGPDMEQLRKALPARPAAFVYQPSGSQPAGLSVSREWISKASTLFAHSHIPVIEIVQTPFLCWEPPLSLGSVLPHDVIHIQSFNFFFGSDLRVGVAGGSEYYIDRMWQQLTFSSRWVSRILQDALAFQLTDTDARRSLQRYVDICRRRQAKFISALRRVGFNIGDQPGPSIWLPVQDEFVVTNQMSSRGIVVHPGSYFTLVKEEPDHVLLNGTILEDGQERIASLLAEAQVQRSLARSPRRPLRARS